ncbi:hypothetical protein WDZ92_31885 [Nostoc sp. NIES-2111]
MMNIYRFADGAARRRTTTRAAGRLTRPALANPELRDMENRREQRRTFGRAP